MIVAKLTGIVRKRPRAERRASRRHVPPQLTHCRLEAPAVAADGALVRDLSRHGAGLLAGQGFEPGTVLRLLLVNAGHTCALAVEYEVVRCTRGPAGTYFLGGRFRRTLAHSELVPFLV